MNNIIVDITDAIRELCPNCGFSVKDDDYNTIVWNERNILPKPSLEEVNSKLDELRLLQPMKILREKRNIKLLETDKYTSIPDWPHPSEEVKQAWVTYRQALRDLPSTSTPQFDENSELTNVTWPTKPS
jgi:hypothetical protein